MQFLVKIAFCALLIGVVTAAEKKNSKESGKAKFSKYSKEANLPPRTTERPTREGDSAVNDREDYRPPKNYATSSERLFKMQKIQNVWQKGQKALNEAKLKALYHDLKTQDKQEIAFKKIKAQGKDKDGLQEAALRVQLAGIIERFGLLASFPEHRVQPGDEHQIDRMFKDKKLNKLWNKIEAAGLDEKEMKILKEELGHHQLKVDQYYAFVDNLHETRDKTPEMANHIGHFLEDEDDIVRSEKKGKSKDKTTKPKAKSDHVKTDQVENLRVKHQELKEDFDSLADKVRAKLNEKEFTDEKAIKLWNLAKNADFNKDELESLRSELHHFEHRIQKLHHLNHEIDLKDDPDEAKNLKNKVLEFERKIEKSHDELSGRIARRSEL